MRTVFVLDIQEESEIWSLYCICDKNCASATPHWKCSVRGIVSSSRKYVLEQEIYQGALRISLHTSAMNLYANFVTMDDSKSFSISIGYPRVNNVSFDS